jgi:hypothetical protein
VLEIHYTLGDAPATIPDRMRAAFGRLEMAS